MIGFQYVVKKYCWSLSMKTVSKNIVCICFITSLLFPACTGKKMSVEDAKQVTVSMSDESFIPPPRRINDILSILSQPGKNESDVVKKHKIMATQIPPKTKNEAQLAEFYYRRGLAALQLFRFAQALEDLSIALDYTERLSFLNINKELLLQSLGIANIQAGNFRRGVQLIERSVKVRRVMSTPERDLRGRGYVKLMRAYYQIGDFEMVEKVKNRAFWMFNVSEVKMGIGAAGIGPTLQVTNIRAISDEARWKLAKAEKLRRVAVNMLNSFKTQWPAEYIANRVYLAQNLARQNRMFEAELAIRQTLMEAVFLSGKDSATTGNVIGYLGEILQKQGRLKDAQKLIDAEIRIIERSGVSPDSYLIANARVMHGNILCDQQKYDAAVKKYDIARKDLRDNQYLQDKLFIRNPNFMLTLLKTKRTEEALKIISTTYDTYQKIFGENHYLTAEIRALRGMANARLKHIHEAFEDFSTSIPVLFTSDLIIKGDYSARQRFKMIIEAYIDLLAQIHKVQLDEEFKINAAAEAFRLADTISNQIVQSALGDSGARVAAGNLELADLVRREQDARQQINTIKSILMNTLAAPENQQHPTAIKNLKNKLDTLGKARSVLMAEIKRRFPKYSEFTDPQPARVDQAQTYLRPGEVLVSIYVSENNTYIWAVPYRGKVKFFIAALGRNETRKIVDSLRNALAPDPQTLEDIPDFDLRSAYRLYNYLLQPIKDTLKNATDLIIIAQGPLGRLPLAILPTSLIEIDNAETELFGKYRNIPWLIRQVAITRCPTVSSFVTLRNLPKSNPDRKAFAGFGDPFFNQKQQTQEKQDQSAYKAEHAQVDGGLHVRGIRITQSGNLDSDKIASSHLGLLNRLPDTADEIKSIAMTLDADLTKDLFLGTRASEQRVKNMDLSDRQVIAFATHALVPGDLDGLDQPALALCSPNVTGENEDGLLTMGEILKLKLNADWVVLSACNTGAAGGAGTEAVSGLGRAFFYAGTRAILVSMWPVETTSARKLTTGLFRFQKEDKTLTRARALQKSILALIDAPGFVDKQTDKVVASYAHPFFWAPFIVVGDSKSNQN
jgi:CHAT domain-containing protein